MNMQFHQLILILFFWFVKTLLCFLAATTGEKFVHFCICNGMMWKYIDIAVVRMLHIKAIMIRAPISFVTDSYINTNILILMKETEAGDEQNVWL